MSRICRNWARKACNKKQLEKKLPVTQWLPKYNANFAFCDLIAGVTVGLTVIPQGIAYALVANLEPQYGLYSAFMGCFVYIFFGTSKDVTVGPTAIMALMTAEYADKGPAYVVLLAFLSGFVIMALGLLRLGMVIDFISVPVIAGFTSAAAITIASSQIKSIFGLDIVHHPHFEGILKAWAEIIENFDSYRVNDTALGLTCIVVLLLMRVIKFYFNQSRFFKLKRMFLFIINRELTGFLIEIWRISDHEECQLVRFAGRSRRSHGVSSLVPKVAHNAQANLVQDGLDRLHGQECCGGRRLRHHGLRLRSGLARNQHKEHHLHLNGQHQGRFARLSTASFQRQRHQRNPHRIRRNGERPGVGHHHHSPDCHPGEHCHR